MAEMSVVIDTLLKKNGITGAKMCQDLNMSKSFMTELRKGRAKSIKIETAQKIAAYFGITVDELYGIESKNAQTPNRDLDKVKSLSEEGLTEGEREMLEIFRLIPEDWQRVFLDQGRAFASSLKKG